MNLEFADDIIDILNYVGDKFGIAIDWSAKTILPYLQELSTKYIAYRISIAVMWAIVFCVVILACVITIITLNVQSKKLNYEYSSDDLQFWLYVVAVILILVSFGLIIYQVYNIILCKTFPEKVIYEYITSLYTTMKSN